MFWQCYGLFWKRYFKWTGRTSQYSYWVNTSILFLLWLFTISFGRSPIFAPVDPLISLYFTVAFIPEIMMNYRRFYDVGVSRWVFTFMIAVEIVILCSPMLISNPAMIVPELVKDVKLLRGAQWGILIVCTIIGSLPSDYYRN